MGGWLFLMREVPLHRLALASRLRPHQAVCWSRHVSSRCSRDTNPESYITQYTEYTKII